MKKLRPVVTRPLPSQTQIAQLGDIDPLHARLFAARGLVSKEELDYALARIAPARSVAFVRRRGPIEATESGCRDGGGRYCDSAWR